MIGPHHEVFEALSREFAVAFGEGVGGAWPESRFDALALRAFAFQFEAGSVYRRFCEARGRTPGTVDHWTAIPLVPTRAFKQLDLANGPVEVEFRTSGTSGGSGLRGRHGVRSLELYRAAALPNLAAHLIPDGEPLPILSLIPSAAEAPTSSLSHMIGFAMEDFGAPGSGYFADAGGVALEAFGRALAERTERGRPVWVTGTAFAFVHWLDAVARGEARPVRLPEGSRVMETGGFKGRSREVSRTELYAGLQRTLGVSVSGIVNEYGMTELLSQFYDGRAGEDGRPPPEERVHRPPPWMRTRVLDPVSLEPVPSGVEGILAHLDLANLGSVSAILTEDRGVATSGGGFRVLGRMAGAEPRGCSLAMEDLVRAGGEP